MLVTVWLLYDEAQHVGWEGSLQGLGCRHSVTIHKVSLMAGSMRRRVEKNPRFSKKKQPTWVCLKKKKKTDLLFGFFKKKHDFVVF